MITTVSNTNTNTTTTNPHSIKLVFSNSGWIDATVSAAVAASASSTAATESITASAAIDFTNTIISEFRSRSLLNAQYNSMQSINSNINTIAAAAVAQR